MAIMPGFDANPERRKLALKRGSVNKLYGEYGENGLNDVYI